MKTTPNCWETMSILVRSLSLANKFQKLLKSAEKYFYSTFSSCAAKLSKKKIFLVRSEILGLLVNMLTANYEYSSSNRENVPLPIQLLLSEKQKSFWSIFFFFLFAFLESPLNFEHFEKETSLITQLFLKLLTPKDVLT